MQRIFLHQVGCQPEGTGVVQVLLVGLRIAVKDSNDLILVAVESLFVALLRKINQQFVAASLAQSLDARVVQAHAVQRRVHGGGVRSMGELYINQGAPAEVDAERKAMPEQHGKNPCYAEYQRE